MNSHKNPQFNSKKITQLFRWCHDNEFLSQIVTLIVTCYIVKFEDNVARIWQEYARRGRVGRWWDAALIQVQRKLGRWMFVRRKTEENRASKYCTRSTIVRASRGTRRKRTDENDCRRNEKEPVESRVSSRRNGKMQYGWWRVNDSSTNAALRQKAPTITAKDGMQEVLQPRCTLSATLLRPGSPNWASLLLCIYSLVPRSFPLFSLGGLEAPVSSGNEQCLARIEKFLFEWNRRVTSY